MQTPSLPSIKPLPRCMEKARFSGSPFPFLDAGVVKLMAQQGAARWKERVFLFHTDDGVAVALGPPGKAEYHRQHAGHFEVAVFQMQAFSQIHEPTAFGVYGQPVVGKGLQLVSERCIGFQFPGIGFRKAAADIKGVYRRKVPVR